MMSGGRRGGPSSSAPVAPSSSTAESPPSPCTPSVLADGDGPVVSNASLLMSSPSSASSNNSSATSSSPPLRDHHQQEQKQEDDGRSTNQSSTISRFQRILLNKKSKTEEKKEDRSSSSIGELGGSGRGVVRRRPTQSSHPKHQESHTSTVASPWAGPNSSFEQRQMHHMDSSIISSNNNNNSSNPSIPAFHTSIAATATSTTPPRTPPRCSSSALRPCSSSTLRTRGMDDGAAGGCGNNSIINSSNNKHVSISPQPQYLVVGGGGGGRRSGESHRRPSSEAVEESCSSSPGCKSLDDADTKTAVTLSTTTAASTSVSALTASSASAARRANNNNNNPSGSCSSNNRDDSNHSMYTALSDMVHCALLTPSGEPAAGGYNNDASVLYWEQGGSIHSSHHLDAVESSAALPIPYTLPPPQARRRRRERGGVTASTDTGEDEYSYYRVAYRGVVALLSAPEGGAPRSGSYLSYGEVFCMKRRRRQRRGEPNANEIIKKKTLGQLIETTRLSPRRRPSNRSQLRDVLGVVPAGSSSLAGDVSGNDSFGDRDGVDALLQQPSTMEDLAKTGPQIPNLPSRSNCSSQSYVTADSLRNDETGDGSISSSESLPEGVVRVDHVLTGGYAMDTATTAACTLAASTKTGADGLRGTPSNAKTPKRSNSNPLGYYIPVHDDEEEEDGGDIHNHSQQEGQANDGPSSLGYLFLQRQNVQIVEPLRTRPRAEVCSTVYKIVSNTPIPILTGPDLDAPKLGRTMLLPGTMHEVSLRMCIQQGNLKADCSEDDAVDADSDDCVWFLRLAHRRGWIADRKIFKRKKLDAAAQATTVAVPVVREVSIESNDTITDESSIVSSIAVSTVSAQSSVARRRHRPPRRQRLNGGGGGEGIDDDNKSLPRHIVGEGRKQQQLQQRAIASTPVKINKPNDSVLSPTSNLSLLSDDDESIGQHSLSRHRQQTRPQQPLSPDCCSYSASTARSIASSQPTSHANRKKSNFYLMRVTAPRGLKVLDAPKYQVNRLLGNVSSSHSVSQVEASQKQHHSIFQTMSGRLSTTAGPTSRVAVMEANSKTRVLPRGVLFEASRRMETTDGYQQGLIKLSDGSGWAIVPNREDLEEEYRSMAGGMMIAEVKEGEVLTAFEEVGCAVIGDDLDAGNGGNAAVSRDDSLWVRVVARSGVPVSCPPPSPPLESDRDNENSPSSSKGSSTAMNGSSTYGPLTSHDSDVASSVGSAFLDAMFRTPKKNRPKADAQPLPARPSHHHASNVIPCGMVVQCERQLENDQHRHGFARLCGGQGWIPLSIAGKRVSAQVPPPEMRHGSFWFRVQSSRGIKVRLGPSRRAPSIKSEDGVYFRFECGEFLRASEIITFFNENLAPEECYAKLYRNRHVRLRESGTEYPPLYSLTDQAEFVQVYSSRELYLEECAMEPRIERHKQGWRYNVVPESGVVVRRGPSFAAEKTDIHLYAQETVVVNERVSPAGERLTWLRLKDGKGWVHDVSDEGEQIMVANSLRHHRNHSSVLDRPLKGPAPKEEIAYNTIIARLFHNNNGDHEPSSSQQQDARTSGGLGRR